MLGLEILLVLLLFTANGLFAMMEMAVVSSRKSRLQQMADAGDARASVALALANAPNRFLPTVQIGITLVGLLAGAFSGITLAEEIAAWLKGWPLLAAWAEAIGVVVVVIALTFLSLVVGELVPKRLALADPEGVACRLARPVDWLSRAARPLVRLLGATTEFLLRLLRVKSVREPVVYEDEIRLLLKEGRTAGAFHQAEPLMVESVLAFDRMPVGDIMTPRAKIVCLQAKESAEWVWHKIVVSGHSRYPVYGRNRDDVLGVVAVKAIYANVAAGTPARLRDVMTPPLFVAPTEPVLQVLERFKSTRQHIALVREPNGRLAGIVTLVDVLEAIVGEIPSAETRSQPEAKPRPDGTWLVDGALSVAQLARRIPGLSFDASTPRVESVAEFVAHRNGRAPREGDCISNAGWRFEVLDMDGNTVDKVLIQPLAKTPPRGEARAEELVT